MWGEYGESCADLGVISGSIAIGPAVSQLGGPQRVRRAKEGTFIIYACETCARAGPRAPQAGAWGPGAIRAEHERTLC